MPRMDVMMLVGVFDWRDCGVAIALWWTEGKEEKLEMVARLRSEWARPRSEAQSMVDAFARLNSIWVVCWLCCKTI